MVILLDDEDRENEGDLVMAADLVTPETINFMARYGRGLICLSLTEERVATLGLAMMASDNRSPRSTAFTVSVDARRGLTTGISARERAETIKAAVAREARPEDLVTPGHVFPLRAREGGVLVRSGHTEGSVDLARLAGRAPAGVICEIMRDDGEMARMPDLEHFAAEHGLQILTIADLIEYRLSQELLVRRTVHTRLRPRGASTEFDTYVYTTEVEDTEYLALVLGQPVPDEPTLVRVHAASVRHDVFGGGDPARSAAVALQRIEAEGRGVLLYVFHRGRVSLTEDFRAEILAQSGTAGLSGGMTNPLATSPENRLREFGLGAQVLAHLGVGQIRLLTNNPRRVVGASGFGLQIVESVPIGAPAKVVPLRSEG
jgi:3,4-dihydroxy 2-butanone 4-phosphate synthase/GTP cyclohydrolase II